MIQISGMRGAKDPKTLVPINSKFSNLSYSTQTSQYKLLVPMKGLTVFSGAQNCH